MIRILFVCVHNSARSQIAEEYTRKIGREMGLDIRVESAGLEPGALNPFVVKSLLEEGIDIAGKKTQSVIDLFNANREYDYVITVCSRETEEKCPIFPGITKRFNWPFDDPAAFTGTEEEILAQVRAVREAIKHRLIIFLKTL